MMSKNETLTHKYAKKYGTNNFDIIYSRFYSCGILRVVF